MHKVVAFAAEKRVLLQAHEHVKVARRTAAHPRLALTRDAQLLPIVDAGRERQRDLAVPPLPTLAAAARAELVDGLAGAATARAGRDVHEPAEHRLLDLAHLATTAAGAARRDRRARLGAAAPAPLAGLQPRHGDDTLAALHRVEEVDLDLQTQVGAAHRAARLAAAQIAAEEGLEGVTDAEVGEPAGRRAEHVVALPALRVGEHLVRLGDPLELLRRVRFVVHVGVELPGELAVSAPDLLVRGRPRDAEKLVVIGGRRHHLSLSGPMEALLRIAVQWLHVSAGVLWIGGGVYTILVQLPALLAAPPAARGPAMAQLAPRQIRYILRVAELTVATGLLNLFVS